MRSITSDKILLQHYVLGYQIHLCFPKYKLTIEVDEKGHTKTEINTTKLKDKSQ